MYLFKKIFFITIAFIFMANATPYTLYGNEEDNKTTVSGYYIIDTEKILKDIEKSIVNSPKEKNIDLEKIKARFEFQGQYTAIKLNDKAIQYTNLYKDEVKQYAITSLNGKAVVSDLKIDEMIQLEIVDNKMLMKNKNEKLPLVKTTKEDYEKILVRIKIKAASENSQNEIDIKLIYTTNVPCAEIIKAVTTFKRNLSVYPVNNEFLLLESGAKIDFLVNLIGILDTPKLSSEDFKLRRENTVEETKIFKKMVYENQTLLFHQCGFASSAEVIRALYNFYDYRQNDISFSIIPTNNGFLIILPTEKVQFFKDIIKILDIPYATKEEYQKEQKNIIKNIASNPDLVYENKSIVSIPLVHIPSAEMIRALIPFLDKKLNDINYVPMPSYNGIIIISPSEKMKFFKDIVKILDRPGIKKDEYEKSILNNTTDIASAPDIEYGENSIKLIHSVYIPCTELIRSLVSVENKINDKDILCSIPSTNGILIIGQKENLLKYQALIKKIDVPSGSK